MFSRPFLWVINMVPKGRSSLINLSTSRTNMYKIVLDYKSVKHFQNIKRFREGTIY